MEVAEEGLLPPLRGLEEGRGERREALGERPGAPEERGARPGEWGVGEQSCSFVVAVGCNWIGCS